jgi:aspartate kinase
MNRVTDTLINISKKAVAGDQQSILNSITKLITRHTEAAKEAINDDEIRNQTIREINNLTTEFRRVALSVSYLKELTPRTKDYLLSFGEKLSTTLVNAALVDAGLSTSYFTGVQVGIMTDDNYGNATPLMKVTTHRVRAKLIPLLEQNIIPVVTGYIAATQNEITTTLGRGGSDYTATIIGYALDADEIWIWTDVNGLMTTDPKIEPNAQTIHSISYLEAMELVYFGAKAMHPKALEPASDKKIPVRIKNSFNPQIDGTLIATNQHVVSEHVVKAVTIIWDVALITLSGAGMIGTPGIAAKVFGILGQKRVNILMISQSSSEANISIIIRRDDLDKAVNLLELAFLGRGFVREVSFEEDICVIAVVGAGMRGTVGVASRIFQAVANEDINVRIIAQGSSEVNVSFVVGEHDGAKAIQALHREFKLGVM